ncbi:hypothetical protein D3C81_2045660 [compost metagenome]
MVVHVVVGGASVCLALGHDGILQVLGLFFGLLEQTHAALAQFGGFFAGGRSGLLEQLLGVGQYGLDIAHQFLLFAGGWFGLCGF